MGSIYRPKYTDRHGVMQQSTVWWVRYRQHGKTIRQSTETTSESKARRFLQEREGKVALNIPVIPKADKLTLGEGADLIRQDYKAKDTPPGGAVRVPRPRRFHGTVRLDPARVGRDASRVADEVIVHLAGQLDAEVTVTLEIDASLPDGASEQVVRIVTENSRTLRFTSQGFESE
jgi:hypothetical protein